MLLRDTGLETLDMHTGGEPLRVFVSGLPPLDGNTVLALTTHSRNVCIFADGERLMIESILGTRMTVQAAQTVKFGPFDAVIPEVGGSAFITGRNQFYFDPEDRLRSGFILR